MPTIIKANPDKVFHGGAEIPVAVKLTEPEAVAAFGAGGLAGWYAFAYTSQSQIARETESEDVRTEGGIIVKKIQRRDDAVITVTLIQTDEGTFILIDILAKSPHLYRMGYPSEEGEVMMFGLRNGFADPNWSMSAQDMGLRTREVAIRGSRTPDGKAALEYAEVDPDTQGDWPAKMNDFKD